jgi:hypothetical protein
MVRLVAALLCSAGVLSACETTIPANDTTFPLVRISALNQGNIIIASTDPDEKLSTDLTCGPATELGVDAFVLRRDFPARLMLTVSDQGGVAVARAIVAGGAISNVEPPDAVLRADATPSGPIAIIEKYYDRSDPRSGQVILFDVTPTTGSLRGPNTVLINGVGADFAGNSWSTSRPALGTQEGLCNS